MEETRLILASQSPRRRELLSLTGIPFEVDAPEVDESCTLGAREAVLELSRRKALAAAAKHPGQVILASDTLVAVDDIPLGKPADEEDAFRMLRSLSSRWHQVYTGVCVISATGDIHAEVDATDVRFGHMTDEAIRAYIATAEPMDKAGAYALQGIAGLWIEEIRGSHTNVIGLPLTLTRRLLEACGLHPLNI
ncbi:MAG: septum formation inhibitor Maf [Clostridia bacterium]|nr:septum formation inhibitor Maf [Clostridia bacterium]